MVEETKAKVQEVAQQPVQQAPAASSLIDAANNAAERLEKANAEHKALIEKEEKMMAMRMLGGRTDAGNQQVKPETPKDYAKRVMSGKL